MLWSWWTRCRWRGTAQARALLRIADRLEVARLVLVGDSRQLRGVEAGQPFRQMQEAGMAVAEMDELRRQRDPDLKAAVQDMIEGEPGEALARLGSNLQELPAEEIARIAAELWLRLSPGARDATALLVPTRALRAEVEEAVREGLEAEATLRGGAMELKTLVPLSLTRAETGDPRNWREGDIALFNREMKHYRVRKDDACTVMEVEEDRVRLAHADGRPRHLKPGSDLRYRLDLFEARTLRIREGEQLRWTRNDRERGLANGDRAEVLEIGEKALRMQLPDGREMTFARDDPQLRHLAYAYASTVHAAQGQTHDRVIAVLDSGAGPLVNQQTLYVQLSRAREQAVVLTDNREQLVETLEANTGERLTALEAIGETVADRAVVDRASAMTPPAKAALSMEAAVAFLDGLREERERRAGAEATARRLAEAEAALEAARAVAEAAERAFAALRAVDLDDRRTLRDRIAAAKRGGEAAQEVTAAADAVTAAALEANRAPSIDGDALEAVRAAADAARTRLEDYRSLETALATADTVSARLAPAVALRDSSLDEASMERHGAACREAAAAFGIAAQAAQAAGEAALAGGAQGKAAHLGQQARHWAYRLENRRHDLATEAERAMAPPLTAADVRAWRDLRARQADAREHAAALAAGIAAAVEPENAGVAAEWRKQAGEYRDRAAAIRDTLAKLDELGTTVAAAEAAPQDEAAWRAAARAAERILKGAGQGLGDEAERARAEEAHNRQARREAARERFGALVSEWDAFRKEARRQGRAAFAGKGSRPYVARARELATDPDLDAEAKKTLTGFLKQYDEVRPAVVKRTGQLFSQWDAVRNLAKSRGVGRFIPPESEAVVEGMRKLAAEHPEHLSARQRKMFETIAAEYDQHAERQRQWVWTMRP